jgi:uncharacterized protein
MKKVVVLVVLAVAANVRAGIQITEWMYQGTNTADEFVEFTNISSTAIDLTGWSYSDNSRVAGHVNLSAFKTVAAGESVILTSTAESAFRTAWGLSSSVRIIGGNITDNLGRSDEINIYDSLGTLVDRLTYGDPGSTPVGTGPRTQIKSCSIPASDYGQTVAQSTWVLSSVGDQYGAWKSSGNDIGSPGQVPEPATMALLGLGALILGYRRKA